MTRFVKAVTVPLIAAAAWAYPAPGIPEYPETRAAELVSAKGGADIKIVEGGATTSFAVSFARAAPDRARLEIRVVGAGTVLVIVTKGTSMLIYDPPRHAAVVAANDAAAFAAFTGWEMGVNLPDFLSWLAAGPPLTPAAAGGVAADCTVDTTGAAVLTWKDENGEPATRMYFGAGDAGLPAAARFYRGGVPAVDITYNDYRTADGVAVPFLISVTTRDAFYEIKIRTVTVGCEFPTAAFDVTPPAGAEIVEVAGEDDRGR